MQVGKKVSRGVFTLADCQLAKPNNAEALYSKTWQQGKVLNTIDITELVGLFTPWLKEVKRTPLLNNLVHKQEHKHESPVIERVISENKSANTTQDISSIDNTATLDLTPSDKYVDVPQAFSLLRYAQNQGSPELAVFMLDDYLDELKELITAMPTIIKTTNVQNVQKKNSNIKKLTRILAADELHETSNKLAQSLNNKAINEANAKITLLKQQFKNLEEFSQTL